MGFGGRIARSALPLFAVLALFVPAGAAAQGSTPPETTITGGPPDGSVWGPSGWPTTYESGSGTYYLDFFLFTSDQPGRGSFECRTQVPANPGTWSAWESCGEDGSGDDGIYYWEDFSESGPARFSVRAVAGGEPDPSPAERSFTIDVDPPEMTITGGPQEGELRTVMAVFEDDPFTFEASEPDVVVECVFSTIPFDAGLETTWVFYPCGSPLDAPLPHSFPFPDPYTAVFGEGPVYFLVRATDELGNVGTPAERGFRVDNDGPRTGFHSEPSGPTSDNTPTFDWFVEDPRATVRCRIDERPFRLCPSPATYGPLPDGHHAFQLRAVDPAGNIHRTELVAVLVDTRVAGPEVQLPADQPQGAPTVVGKAGARERTNARMRAVVKVDGESYRMQSRKAAIPAKQRRTLKAVPVSAAVGRKLEAALSSGERASVRTVTRFTDRLGNSAKRTRHARLRLR
jgi:hypothetical protein